MAKEIDKIIQSKTAPKSNNVLWDDGENLNINRNGKWESTGGGAPMINITYANLVELRNNGELIAGMQYRITDYVTTTAQENTLSAGHPFDIIVLALSENTLVDEAYAIQSTRDIDGYFANNNLAAWKLRYCLDNDINKFAWADVENGKGVIYNMIDEWNNDLPYDFKNIQYEDKQGFTYHQWGKESFFSRDESLDKTINGVQYYGYTTPDTPIAWSDSKCWVIDVEPSVTSSLYYEDGSVVSYGGSILSVSLEYRKYYTFAEADDLNGGCYKNIIKSYLKDGVQNLNKICFDNNSYCNMFEDNCYNNSFTYSCRYNSFGYDCYNNTFHNVGYNSFGNNCHTNNFEGSHNNSFGDDCCENIFDNSGYNIFGNGCSANIINNNCNYNTFGNKCMNNILGINCNNNAFDNNCNNITLNDRTEYKTVSINSNGEVKVFNLADLLN